MKIKYFGTESFQEQPVTGTFALWQPNQESEIAAGTRTNILLAIDGFCWVNDDSGYIFSNLGHLPPASEFAGVAQDGHTLVTSDGIFKKLVGENFSAIGMRSYPCSVTADYNNSTPKTFEDIVALATEFDQIQIIINNPCNTGATTKEPIFIMSLAALADDSLETANAATWTKIPFCSRAASSFYITDTQLIESGKYRHLMESDWLDISSVSPTNSDFPLLGIRTYLQSANPISLNGSTYNMSAWATHDSGRTWRTSINTSGDNASTATDSFSRDSAMNQSPIFAIRFRAKNGRVLQLFTLGDSISEMSSGALYGDNWAFKLANLLHTTDLPVELAYTGKSGMTSIVYTDSFLDMFNSKNGYATSHNLTVTSGGAGYAVGDLLWIQYGGVIRVTAETGGAITAATFAQYPVVPAYQKGSNTFDTANSNMPTNGGGTGASITCYYQNRGYLKAPGYGILLMPSFSPNDSSASPLSASSIARSRANANAIIDFAHGLGLAVAVWSPLPAGLPDGESGTARTAWGSTDALRAAYALEVLGGCFKNADYVLDFSFLTSDTLNADGMETYKSEYGASGSDWLHPNNAAAIDMANYAYSVFK